MNTVLETLRSLLKFKESTTISEIAAFAKLPKAKVLDIINRNGHLIYRVRKTGRITSEACQQSLKAKLYTQGAYFTTSAGNYGSWTLLRFNGHDQLRKELERTEWAGGFGDSWKETHVFDTPENRQRLIADGCRPEEEMIIDDRLWEEN